MFFSNLLILGVAAVATVSARAIGEVKPCRTIHDFILCFDLEIFIKIPVRLGAFETIGSSNNTFISTLLQTTQLTTLTAKDPSTSSQPQCAFHPHNHLTHEISQRPITPSSYTNIPSHAWPHISSLLLSHSSSLTSGPPLAKNSVQTLRLSSLTNDVTLESVVLGLVFTAPENEVGNLELRDLSSNKMAEELVGEMQEEGEERKCVQDAVRRVEGERQVEGVLEMSGRGKMGFLVYRVD
ncbi:uncharacterized protein LY89DRAFT_673735 [Mollisia scopiformis]|uniref:Uncharacterized protein n=1 Tax=Mollisia scopiformis TaxID=149040 RepID=A0A194WW84_MOLSC|nr:uncharacterized protein LY89DRAFT_673735 [Mollisia scopiformis]KUJ11929.1 hypothetical protein LY89DRAFT_673735 [Mollisia scopiformis]